MRKLVLLICLLLILTAIVSGDLYSQSGGSYQSSKPSNKWKVHVELGIPKDQDDSNDYLIKRNQYVLSYNTDKNVANWVSWNLNKKWFGKTKRYKGNFLKDPLIQKGAYKVKHSDYTNSGYDRGHMVMSEERTRTKTDNKSTFYLSNILPQTEDLNQILWRGFEDYCNDLCRQDNKELYIIAGGIFHTENKIKNKICIPDSCFKIVVVLDRGEGVQEITDTTLVIAVMMPNQNGIDDLDWKHYTTSVRKIEWSTGYDFLNSVDSSIQDVIERQIYRELNN